MKTKSIVLWVLCPLLEYLKLFTEILDTVKAVNQTEVGNPRRGNDAFPE